MDAIALSEELMRRGWWAQALTTINRYMLSPADQTLQLAAYTCRRECAEWAMGLDLQMPETRVRELALQLFDRYTVIWFFDKYSGKGSLQWRRNERENALMG